MGSAVHSDPPIRSIQLRMGALNRANGRLFSFSRASEYQYGLGKGIGHEDLIMGRVVADVVHGAAQMAFLSGQKADGLGILLRQPGEGRNLRMGHSIWNQNFSPLAVISGRARIPNRQRHIACRRTADGS